MDVNGKIFKKFLDRRHVSDQHLEQAITKQHAKGKLSARERIELLFDRNTFEELDEFATSAKSGSDFGKADRGFGDGVITGFGKINGRLTFVYAQDFTIMGGSLGAIHAAKITKIMDLSLKMGAPIVGLIDSGGARIQDGVVSLS